MVDLKTAIDTVKKAGGTVVFGGEEQKPATIEIPFTIFELESSMISRVGYCPKQEILMVFIKTDDADKLYSYKGVPSHVLGEILTESSVGAYFNQWIKGKYERID